MSNAKLVLGLVLVVASSLFLASTGVPRTPFAANAFPLSILGFLTGVVLLIIYLVERFLAR